MEFHVSRQKDRNVTRDLFKRFLRTTELLHSEVKLVRTYANQTGFTAARLEMPAEGVQTRRIIILGRIDGLIIMTVSEQKDA